MLCIKRSVTKNPMMKTTLEIHNALTAKRPLSDSRPSFLMVDRAREIEMTPMSIGRLQKIKGASHESSVCSPSSAAPMSPISANGEVR